MRKLRKEGESMNSRYFHALNKKQIDESRDLQTKRKRILYDQDKRDEKEFVELWKDKLKLLVND
jgi:hypothetical protein